VTNINNPKNKANKHQEVSSSQKVKTFDLTTQQPIAIAAYKVGINGEGIGQYSDKIVFTPNLLSGEEALVKIAYEYDRYYGAQVEKITKASPLRVEPKCPFYLHCGACTLAHVEDRTEQVIKKGILLESLKKYAGGVQLRKMEDFKGDDIEYHYRNKVVLPIRNIRGVNYFGLIKPRSNHFQSIDYCLIQDDTINEILTLIINVLNKHHLNGIDIKQATGNISYIIIRCAHFSRQVQITFVLVKDCDLSGVINEILLNRKDINSISKVINTKTDSKQLFNETETILYGSNYLTETLGDFQIKLLPSSFFQLNTPVALKIYQHIVSLIEPLGIKTAVDAYSGVGVIGMFLSKVVDKVYSIDIEKANFEANKRNLLINDIKNVKLINKDFLLGFKEIKNEPIDLIVFDPPRVGLGSEVRNLLINSNIPYVIYLSCNSSTLAKDLHDIKTCYEIETIYPYNMFPKTSHIETLCFLKRISKV
jgi:23S rRNA (uracil1939-C5)-methyltransferase